MLELVGMIGAGGVVRDDRVQRMCAGASYRFLITGKRKRREIPFSLSLHRSWQNFVGISKRFGILLNFARDTVCFREFINFGGKGSEGLK